MVRFGTPSENEPFLEFPCQNWASTVRLEPVGENLFRLESIMALPGAAGYKDVVEAVPVGRERFRFVRVVEPSGWQEDFWHVRRGYLEEPMGEAAIRRIEALGGRWRLMPGGLLSIYTPPGVLLGAQEWLERLPNPAAPGEAQLRLPLVGGPGVIALSRPQ